MNPSAEVLAWALVHFIWQGAALALVAFFAMRWLRLSAEGRYVAGIVTLAAMLAAPVVTYAVLARGETEIATVSLAAASNDVRPSALVAATDPAPTTPTAPHQISQATLLLLAAWLCGVAVFSVRLAGGWIVARRMVTRGVRPVTPDIALMARRVAGRLALDRAVRIIESSAVTVPVMVGWLKPIVLLPAVAVSGLTPTQIEALIAHELAHVRRHDYLVNLLQAAVETLLFYHPAVWWVSKQVRAEREHCCDDLAVRVCDRLVYVSALSDLAAMGLPKTVLAATGGSLLTRVRRILGGGEPAASTGGAWVPGLIALVVLGAVVPALGSGLLTQADATTQARTDNVAIIEEAAAKPPQAEPREAEVPVQATTAPPPSVEIAELLATQTTAERDRILRDIQVLLEQLRRQASESSVHLDRDRLALEHARAEIDTKHQLEASKVQLDDLFKQRARMRQLVEKGLASHDELARMENRIQELEMTMAHAREQMDVRMKELEIAKRELANRESGQQSRHDELARVYAELLARKGHLDQQAREVTRAEAAEMERLSRQYKSAFEAYKQANDEMQEPRERSRLAAARSAFEYRKVQLLAETVPVTNPAEQIRAGDVLFVEISGESELPQAYLVERDGTVRLPILGAIKVVGLNVQQAGQAIKKQVSRVNSSANVNVSLRRPRSEEPRQR
jgi:beta-lactamase regulating signal transducer with metallopeptidase domain